ncbi:hypothetical protein ACEPAG_6689 [Sanghuangporus baumii]
MATPSTNSGEFCFNPTALAILEQCVRRLTDDGGSTGRDPARLWSDAALNKASSGAESSFENTRTRVDEIQVLKSLSKNMGRLKKNLDMFIGSRCDEILPCARQHGLACLPNEILLHVFEQLLDLYGNPFFGSFTIIRDMSLVSKRFRENVLAFAEVWTYLDLDICGNEALSLFLQRSRNRLLNVSFGCSSETMEIVRRTLQSSDRWQALFIYLDVGNPEHLSLLPSLSFPAVKTLEIHGHNEQSYSWIFPGWTFPCTEDVTLGGTIPDPEAFRYELLKTLTYFVPHYSEYHDRAPELDPGPVFDRLFRTRLFNFLRPAISLYALYLDVRFNSDDMSNSSLAVELPNVRIFSISNWESNFVPDYSDYSDGEYEGPWDERDHDDYFTAIASAIKLPNVQDIRVKLAFEGRSIGLERWLQLAFPRLFRSISVTSLTFAIRQREDKMDAVTFGEIFEYFPSLQSLALDTRYHDGVVELWELWGPDSIVLENLESLQMKFGNITEGRIQIYRMLREIVELGAPLRKVDIRSPYTLDIEVLEAIVPGAGIYTATLNTRV